MAEKQERVQLPLHGLMGAELRTTSRVFLGVTLAVTVLLIFLDISLDTCHRQITSVTQQHMQAMWAINEFGQGAEGLTSNARSFVVTGDTSYLDNYFYEVHEGQKRQRGLSELDQTLNEDNSSAYDSLVEGLDASNALVEVECHAMRLAQLGFGVSDEEVPSEVSHYVLPDDEQALDSDGMCLRAKDLLFGEDYRSYQGLVVTSVDSCFAKLNDTSSQEVKQLSNKIARLTEAQTVLLAALAIAVALEAAFITTQIRLPLSKMAELMGTKTPIEPAGATELRLITQAYNEALERTERAHNQLSHEATHDALTGLKNRYAYGQFMNEVDSEHIALLVMDVDRFKEINDAYGHDVGDLVLMRVAEVLRQSFRSVDAICRMGGDEFVVVMTNTDSSMADLVTEKMTQVNEMLRDEKDGLPGVTLSTGVVFSDGVAADGQVFKDADLALYRAKASGNGKCCIWGRE